MIRIPFTRIYRAFPELDRFSDEQCARFVHAATRTGIRRHLHRALLLVILCFLIITGMILFGVVYEAAGEQWDPRWPASTPYGILWLLLMTLCPALPPAATLLARDILLRRRIRHVLRASGTCPACRYSLVGLPVSASNTVVCPECGSPYDVDPSLSELTIGADGQGRFTPGVIARRSAFWTPARLRRAKRILIAAGALVLLGLPAGWGIYEIFLARQAAKAKAERPGAQGLAAYVDAHQPPGLPEDEPNAFDLLGRASALLAQADAQVLPSPPQKAPNGREIYPEYALILPTARTHADDAAGEEPDADRLAYDAACRTLALQCLDAYARQGLFEALRDVTTARRAARPLPPGVAQPLQFMTLPDLGEVRAFARINVGRMSLARQDDDLPAFADAFENSLALARMIDHQPCLIDGLVAAAIEHTAIQQAEAVLAERPEAPWLDAIQGAIERQRDALPRDYHIEGERLLATDTVAWAFSDPSRVRFGKYSGVAMSLWASSVGEGRLGSYGENLAAVNAYFAQASAAAKVDAYQRLPLSPFPPGRLVLLDILLPSAENPITTFDQIEMDRRGLAVLLALERHRLARADYPATLDELVPAFLPALPLDLWSGQPPRYRRLGDDPESGFLLYAFGIDRLDNGGESDPERPVRAARPGGEGLDYVISGPPGHSQKAD